MKENLLNDLVAAAKGMLLGGAHDGPCIDDGPIGCGICYDKELERRGKLKAILRRIPDDIVSQLSTDELVNELRKRQVLQELKHMPKSLDGVYIHVREREVPMVVVPDPDPASGCNHSESYAKGASCSWCGEVPGPKETTDAP